MVSSRMQLSTYSAKMTNLQNLVGEKERVHPLVPHLGRLLQAIDRFLQLTCFDLDFWDLSFLMEIPCRLLHQECHSGKLSSCSIDLLPYQFGLPKLTLL